MNFIRRHKRALILLIAFLVGIAVLAIPHDKGELKGTVPDEWAYYNWGEYYLEGKPIIPITELGGADETVVYIIPDAQGIYLKAVWTAGDDDAKENDIYLTAATLDGDAVSYGEIFVGGERYGMLDLNGTAVISNVTTQRLEISVNREISGTTYFGSTVVERAMGSVTNYDLSVAADVTVKGEPQFETGGLHTFRLGLLGENVAELKGLRFSINGTLAATAELNKPFDLRLDKEPPVMISAQTADGRPLVDGVLYIDGCSVLLDNNGSVEFSGFIEARMVISAKDVLDNPIGGGAVTLDSMPLGETDREGRLVVNGTFVSGQHRLGVAKKGIDTRNLYAVVVEHEGEYYLASHWPPGLSVMIALLIPLGTEPFLSVILLAAGAYSIFGIGRMYLDDRSGQLAAVIWLFSGGTLLMAYSRYMADLATAVLAVSGFYLLLRAVETEHWGLMRKSLYSMGGGFLMAAAVPVRYSTGVVLIAPALIVLIYIARCFSLKERKVDRESLKRILVIAVSFAITSTIILGLLFYYNDTLFGGPLNSGYQMDTRLYFSSDSNTSVGDPSKNFVESKLVFSGGEWDNIPRQLSLLLYMQPALLLFPVGMWLSRKRTWSLAMVLWIAAIMVVYFSQEWAGSWIGNDVRSMEDMRYFLPALAPAAVILGALLSRAWEGVRKDEEELSREMVEEKKRTGKMSLSRWIVLTTVLLLCVSGALVASYGIGGQMMRLNDDMMNNKGPFEQQRPQGVDADEPATGDVTYADTDLATLLADPLANDGKSVYVRNLNIVVIVRPNMFRARDGRNNAVFIHNETGSNFPNDLKVGDGFEVWGEFRRAFNNLDGLPNGDWEINVRADVDKDRLVVSSPTTRSDGVDRDKRSIAIVWPPTDKPLPRDNFRFAAHVFIDPLPQNAVVQFSFGKDWIKAEKAEKEGDWTVRYDLRQVKEKEFTVRVQLKIGGEVVGGDEKTYTLGNQVITGPPGMNDEKGGALFSPPQLLPALLMIIISLVFTYSLAFTLIAKRLRDRREPGSMK